MKNFFLVLSHYNFIQIKVRTKKSMTLQPFNISGWKWLSAYRYFTFVKNRSSLIRVVLLLQTITIISARFSVMQ